MTDAKTVAELGEDGIIRLFAEPNRPSDPRVAVATDEGSISASAREDAPAAAAEYSTPLVPAGDCSALLVPNSAGDGSALLVPNSESSALLVPNGDDAAAWRFASGASVVTTDSLVEGQHFDPAYTPAYDVGRKLMAVNLSDLAAMGATPRYALISLCLPGALLVSTARAIADGLHAQARRFGVAVIGGNTTGIAGPMVLTATLIGQAAPEVLRRRRGTPVGASIFVTGTLGDAAAGLHGALAGRRPAAGEPEHHLFRALVDPVPRVAAGIALARTGDVFSMCDVSDGLGRDLRHLLAADGLGARIEADRLPISSSLRAYAAAQGLEAERIAMAGGEDYELLFTARAEDEATLTSVVRACGADVSRIGVVVDGPVEVVYADGHSAAMPTGFEHYSASSGQG